MGIYRGPTIVRDGLILLLDAANPTSYPGSGTSWYDVSNSKYNSTLYNNPTYKTNNKGCFEFNGTSNYWRRDEVLTLSNHTVISFVSLSGITQPWICIFEFDNGIGEYRAHYYVQGTSNPYIEGRQGFGANWSTNSLDITRNTWAYPSLQLINVNNWCMLSGVYNSGSGYTYINLNRAKPPIISGSTYSNITTTRFQNARINGVNSLYSNGLVAITMLYNRALSVAELEQNFNAYRGRFGI